MGKRYIMAELIGSEDARVQGEVKGETEDQYMYR